MELGHLSLLLYIVLSAWQKMAVPQQSATICIRRATSENAPGILACLREAFEDYRQFYTPDAFLDTVLTPETIHERLAKMIVFVAPMVIGGGEAPSLLSGDGVRRLTEAHRFRFDRAELVGRDLMITAYPA